MLSIPFPARDEFLSTKKSSHFINPHPNTYPRRKQSSKPRRRGGDEQETAAAKAPPARRRQIQPESTGPSVHAGDLSHKRTTSASFRGRQTTGVSGQSTNVSGIDMHDGEGTHKAVRSRDGGRCGGVIRTQNAGSTQFFGACRIWCCWCCCCWGIETRSGRAVVARQVGGWKLEQQRSPRDNSRRPDARGIEQTSKAPSIRMDGRVPKQKTNVACTLSTEGAPARLFRDYNSRQ
jgi:hypothetical protein